MPGGCLVAAWVRTVSFPQGPADKIDGMNPLLPLDLDALRHALMAPTGEFARVDVVAETGSTNADVVAAASEQWPDLSVLIAENQLAGRGRLDREWNTPPGSSIIASVLLRPGDAGPGLKALGQEAYSWISLLAALALADALDGAAG